MHAGIELGLGNVSHIVNFFNVSECVIGLYEHLSPLDHVTFTIYATLFNVALMTGIKVDNNHRLASGYILGNFYIDF